MSNHLYGHSSTATGGASASAAAAYSAQSLAEPYHPLSYSYLGSADVADPSKTSAASVYLSSAASGTGATWPPGVDVPSSASAVDSLTQLSIKRSYEALYNQSLLQSEAWYSTNYLVKRPRFELASHLPIYPQRPGEKDCAHYMQMRTCKFGETCRFDHPIWVPEGGIPDWKEIPLPATPETLPVRRAAPDCPFFMKTQLCKFGSRCKFNHPQENFTMGSSEHAGSSILPERPTEPPCSFYMKTGSCKFGVTCKFNHPKDIQLTIGQQEGSGLQMNSAVNPEGVDSVQPTLALMHNTKGLPIRLGEVDCPFYLKTGSCKYGVTCRYNHPDRHAIIPPAVAYSHPVIASPASRNIGVLNPVVSVYQTIDPRLTQPTLSLGASIYPQRPGLTECDFYMKTGVCKFGETCRFHHPIDRLVPTTHSEQDDVKLTLTGLPRREGAIHCPYYLKTGSCKYGITCKFDHPPPVEVMAGAAPQGTSTTVGGVEGDDSD